MAPLTTHNLYPPFPLDLPTASLVSISLRALQSFASPPSSPESLEGSRLFTACLELGFFYLDLTGSELGESILREAEVLHTLQQEFFALPHEVKDEYGQDKVDPFFSYRWTKCPEGINDMWGRPGRREMYNVSRSMTLSPLRKPSLAHARFVCSYA